MWVGKFSRTEGEGEREMGFHTRWNLIVLRRELFGMPVVGNSVNGTQTESLLLLNCST
jgi:hypothetical protein